MKPLHIFIVDLFLAAAAVLAITSCQNSPPPSPEFQAKFNEMIRDF